MHYFCILSCFIYLTLLSKAFGLPAGVEMKRIFANHKNEPCPTQKCKDENKIVVNVIKFNLKKLNPIVISKSNYEIGKSKGESISETGTQFFHRNNVDIAINANFFEPCCLEEAEPKDLKGLVISEGKLVSPLYSKTESVDGSYSFIINFDQTMDILSYKDLKDLSNIHTAVSGSHLIVDKGKVIKIKGKFSTERHPRTILGLDKAKRTLILVAFDGRQEGYSSGATFEEAAKWLLKLGADKALNLDGGGSTIMVIKDEKGKTKIFNSPSSMRYNANHIGFRFGSRSAFTSRVGFASN